MARLAFLGTGLLGGAFAEAAAKRGDTVVAWNRSPDKARALAPFGVAAAATPAEAVAGASRAHLALKDDAVVEEVIAAARPGLAADAVLVDHSTTLPALTAERAVRLGAQGIAYLHCPVSMSPAAVRSAQGLMLAAGPKAVFERVRADLEKMTGRLSYVGERPDLAAVYKLLANALSLGIRGVLSDILAIAKAADVTAEDTVKMLGLLDVHAFVIGRANSMIKGDFTPTFELTMARKDVRLMIETAGDLPLAALPSLAARMDALIAAGRGGQDASVLVVDSLRANGNIP
ncbi:MAG: NAD(P)-binding domain-containing protein [Candidatus Accumulibacter sp.]|jgi:3-hydroxyisobutyrate dehydrogenase-like beta-hydroxyacid dehydrogenase|nr:NAD(P)-binding domain-containing protein [Accumulibacter sp.]